MLAQSTAPVAAPKQAPSKKVKTTEVSLVERIQRLQQRDELVGNSIAFRYPDKSVKVMEINKHFVHNENGRPLPIHTIIENINALQWDFGASSFDIE